MCGGAVCIQEPLISLEEVGAQVRGGAKRCAKLMTVSHWHAEQGEKLLQFETERKLEDEQISALLGPSAAQTVVSLQDYEAKLKKKYQSLSSPEDQAAAAAAAAAAATER